MNLLFIMKIKHIIAGVILLGCIGTVCTYCTKILTTNAAIESQSVQVANIWDAARAGDAAVVAKYLSAGSDPNALNADDFTPLYLACLYGHTDVVKLLLQADAINLECPCFVGETALSAAARFGHVDIVRILLQAGADVHVKNFAGGTSLMTAAENGHVEIVKMFLEKGADVNVQSLGYTALYHAAEKGHTEVVKLLLQAGAELGVKAVVFSNNKKDVEKPLLIDGREAWVSIKAYTPYEIAIANGHTEIAKLLLETEFLDAVCDGDVALVQKLLKQGVGSNIANDEGCTALMHAAFYGQAEVINILLEAGASINAVDVEGCTALMHAVKEEKTEVVKRLIHAGANLQMVNKEGDSALQIAKKNNLTECVELLEAAAVKP